MATKSERTRTRLQQVAVDMFAERGFDGVTVAEIAEAAGVTQMTLLSGGIAASWSFGREFIDGTAPALFAVATPRSRIAAAKIEVLIGWGLAVVAVTVLITMVVGLALDLGPLAWRVGGRGPDARRRRSAASLRCPTSCSTLREVPYAAPSLWLGMGGVDAAGAVPP